MAKQIGNRDTEHETRQISDWIKIFSAPSKPSEAQELCTEIPYLNTEEDSYIANVSSRIVFAEDVDCIGSLDDAAASLSESNVVTLSPETITSMPTNSPTRVRTRFAPSPTGGLHAGSVRTALFSLAYARAHGGTCVLRIEDTDAARSTKASLVDILDSLEWLGLKFDSGPKLEDVKNDILDNRFFQSQRQAIYNKYIEQLLQHGYARAVDGAILFTPNFEQPHGNFEFEDAILGRIKTDQKMLKDGFIIRKADGMPTFHMAVVVDDHLMGITHVIRGQDHVPNTPKHILLQRALGFATPVYAHLPLILDEHGAKLSKRREDQKVLIKDFRTDGFLPEVLVSYLGSLGWSPEGRKDDDQILSPDEILKRFDLSGVSASNSRFDMKKLQSLNAANLLRMRAEDLVARMEPFISRGYSVDSMVAAMPVVQPRLKTLADSRVFESLFGIRPDISRINVDQAARDILSSVRAMVDLIDIWTKEEILFTLKNCATRHGVKLGEVAQPIRLALTGQKCSPPIDDVIVLLGKEETKHRIDNALLAGVK